MHCRDPENLLYNDLVPKDAKLWVAALKPQLGTGRDDTVTFCGWRQVRTVYVVKENNKCMPPELQIQFAETAGSKVEKSNSGQVPIVSMPARIAEIVKAAVERG